MPDRRRALAVADRALLWILFAVLGLVALAQVPFGGILGMQTDPCGADGYVCDYGAVSVGVLIAVCGGPASTAVAIVVAVVLVARGRLASWVPLAGLALAIGLFLTGGAIVGAAVSRPG